MVTSGIDTGLASVYQDKIPFLVYLNVKGKITTPDLSFELDIPKEAQSDAGGVVYGRVQQLNEQEPELNKAFPFMLTMTLPSRILVDIF